MNKINMMFFDTPDDSGGGGEETSRGSAVFDAPAKETTGDHELPTKETETTTDTTTTTVAPATGTVDAKALAKEFGAVIGEQFKTQAEKDKPPLTAEEAEKLLNVWKPSKEWLAKFGNLETQEEALKELRDGFIRHSDTITQHRLRELQSAIEEKFNPIMERMQQMDTQQRESRFDSTFPQLAKPALKPLIHAVAQDLVEKGKTFDDESSMFKALAEGVETVIKETNPDFKLQPAGSTPASNKSRANNAIPVTTPGSGGGTGKKEAPSVAKPRGLAIFDKP